MSNVNLSERAGFKIEKTLVIFAIIMLVVALLFPLIIWDALGSGAMHFMQHGHVSVAGSSAGDSKATFLFGLDYTLTHMGSGTFIPSQLFAAQWRVVLGTTEASPLADTLGTVTLLLTVLLFVTPVIMTAVYIADRKVDVPAVRQAAKITSAACAGIELATVIWFGIVLVTMMTKINRFSFRIYDFNAYGGWKFALEVVLNLVLCILNAKLFMELSKSTKTN